MKTLEDPGKTPRRSGSGRSPEGPARKGRFDLPEGCMIILPLRGVVLFPGGVMPFTIGRRRSIEAVKEAMESERPLGLLLQRDPEVEEPTTAELHRVGTVASILRHVTTPDGGHHVICQGEDRFRAVEWLEGYPFFAARVESVPESEPDDAGLQEETKRLRELLGEVFKLMPHVPRDMAHAIDRVTSASALADVVASVLDLKAEQKQELLETFEVRRRLQNLTRLVEERLELLQLSQAIDEETRGSMKKAQREYFLREQLKTIQKELGDGDAKSEEMDELRTGIDEAGMPEEVEKRARKELARLERMPEASAEFSMVRTYLEWLIELPWKAHTDDALDISRAREILDEDHHDLDRVKKRILEFLAVRKLNPSGKSPILCLVGPPGVGKTSLGQSIARAMGRKFVRISVGGIHDEAEIRGHRRTYIGALPGNIIEGIRKAGVNNPVFMIDELDKMGMGIHGDPSSALLEVLDPEQNNTFRDTYLGLPFDLSRVLFIGTANVLENIRGPLRDRLEVIELPGYTEEEKIAIAREYLVTRQLENNGLRTEQCTIDTEALQYIVRHYTREAGVRNLEREIGSALRQVAVRVAEGRAEHVHIDEAMVPELIGPRKFESEVAMRTSIPGVATGLAWTSTGGEILFVEATRMAGEGKLILTGQLGDVMKESAHAALSLIRSRSKDLGIPEDLFQRSDLHVHVPAGSVPKDGPSAGIAIYVALASLLTGRTVRSDAAMTGELSLRGLVLPVGGIKGKVLAAMRAGIEMVLLPRRNEKDLEEVPAEARRQLRFVWLSRVEDALNNALEAPDAPAAAPPSAAAGEHAPDSSLERA